MRCRILYPCLLGLWLVGMRASAQSPDYRIPGYSVTHYTDENGLPQNSVKDICMDDEGYVWLATEVGLVRYDGRRFRLFPKEDMHTSRPRVEVMGRQPFNGKLYAITEGPDMVRLTINTHKQVFFPINPYFSNRSASERYGQNVSFYIYHRSKDYPPFHDKDLYAVIYVSPDTFFLANPFRVIFRTYRQVIWEADAPRKPGYHLYWHGKKLYYYNNRGIFEEVTSQGIKPALQIPKFKRLLWNLAQQQAFVLNTDNDLLLLETDSAGQPVPVPFIQDLPPDFEPETVFHLNKKTVFIGSLQKGLLVCKKQYFKTLYPDLPGRWSVQYALLAHGNDIITAQRTRIAPDGGMSSLIKGAYTFNISLASLNSDTVLFAQANDVLVYSMAAHKIVRTLPMGNTVNCLYTDPQGRVWIAVRNSGLYILDRSLTLQSKVFSKHLAPVNNMIMVSPGHLLLGTVTGLLSFYTRTGRLEKHRGTERYNIRHIFRSDSGQYYFCTYGDGIFMLGRYGLRKLTLDRLEYLKIAHCILEDNKHNLWISTNKGLFYVHETELISYARGIIPRIYYHYFDKENGFGSNEFNGGCQPCGIRLESGHFAFPSMNGIVKFHPDSVSAYFPLHRLSVDRVSVDDAFLKEVPETVSVKRDFRHLEIFMTMPFYGSPYNLYIEYTTDSTRPDTWTPLYSDRRVAFTSVPSGYSQVHFRQKKIAGLGAYHYYTLTLYKPKAFWEFGLFWVACLTLGILAVASVVRLRTRALKQRNRKLAEAVDKARHELLLTIDSLTETTQKLEKKTRFQQWVTSSIIHDLRGPLRFINFYGGDIKRDQSEISSGQGKFLKSVYFSALKIYNYTDNLVQLLRMEQTNDFPPQKTDFMELVEDKIDQFGEQARWNHVTLLLDPDSDPFIYVNGAALSIILQNLLDNAIKNVRHGTIHISLKSTEHRSVIEVRDEGPGMPPELLEKLNREEYIETGSHDGLGLRLVKSLMVQTSGSIRFENLPKKGLKVQLSWEIPQEGKRWE